jgi:thiamine-phosphate pyrophosphorylase
MSKPASIPGVRGLHAIVDVDVAQRAGRAPVDLAAAFLEGGARVLQIRAKLLSGAALLDLAIGIHELAIRADANLIVNDRADIARIAGAAGVHLGQDDLAPDAARLIMGPSAIIGVSTHTDGQVTKAVDAPVTYIAIGPVFETSSKATGYAAVGLEGVRRAASLAKSRGLDIIAIGGITLDRLDDVIEAGASGVAAIADLLASGRPEARVREYVTRLAQAARV